MDYREIRNLLKMAIDDQLIYETNEQGERVVIKSLHSTHRAFLRFSNRTKRPIDVWWRDFEGHKCHYVRLEANASFDVNSFVTHPWEFTDPATDEHYGINNKPVFRAPPEVGDMMYRTNWNITIRLRTLRATALLAVAERVPCPEMAGDLDLPRSLICEIASLVQRITAANAEPRIRLI